jgi:sialate O-acetylesterase
VATDEWTPMVLPRWMDGELAKFDGIVWFRREIDVPETMAGRPLELALGPVDDSDITWVNGVQVGETPTEGFYAVPRHYPLPAGLVHAGRNTVVVRVLDRLYGGGIAGYPTELRLVTRDTPALAIPLAGVWRYRIGVESKVMPPAPAAPGDNATGLYNGMIAPLTRFPIRGVIWYQGEANVSQGPLYRDLLTALIRSWRAAWHDDFPFLIIQLPNLGKVPTQPTDSALARFREAQQQVLAEPHTGMIVTIDVGEPGNLHPKNKQEVGRRLALLAERDVYDQRVIAVGPI